MPSFTFRKEERLKSRKIIGQIFKKGNSVNAYPFRLVWVKTSLPVSDVPIQFALTVPKRAFPKATQRNRIRRQMREAYRLNKPYLFKTLAQGEEQFAWMLIYIAKEGLPYLEMEKAMQKLIKRFLKQISAD